MDAAERGREEPPVAFGESVLAPELFVGVVAFLDPHQAMRSAQTCKDWWRNGAFQWPYSRFVVCPSYRSLSHVSHTAGVIPQLVRRRQRHDESHPREVIAVFVGHTCVATVLPRAFVCQYCLGCME